MSKSKPNIYIFLLFLDITKISNTETLGGLRAVKHYFTAYLLFTLKMSKEGSLL